MKREGFISIISLIVMAVLLSMSMYLGYLSNKEYLILNASNFKNQSYYQSEGKIHLMLYDEYYYNQLYLSILEAFRTNEFAKSYRDIKIKDADLNFGDHIQGTEVKFTDYNNRKIMNIIVSSSVNGSVSKLVSSGTIVNYLFENEYPVLDPSLVEESHINDLNNLLQNLEKNISISNCHKPEDMWGFESDNFTKIHLLKKGNSHYELRSKRQSMENVRIETFSQNKIFLIAKQLGEKKVELHIGDGDNSSDIKDLAGIIYVEGDIIISSNFKFQGIIIVKGGEIINNSTDRPDIYGLIITDNMKNYDEFLKENRIIRSKHVIYRYGTYLPGYLDFKLDTIKGI